MPDALLAMVQLARRGPLDGAAPIPGVSIAAPLRRVSLHGNMSFYAGIALPRTPLRAVLSDDTAILWLGPEEWLVLAPADDPVMYGNGSVVDISHRQIGLEISGPHAAMLLNAACPLDLDLTAFPVGACTRTVFAKAQIALWRRSDAMFHLDVARSFAAYVYGILREAAMEFSAAV